MITNYIHLLPKEIIQNIHKINEKEYHQNLIHEFISICSEIKNRVPIEILEDDDEDFEVINGFIAKIPAEYYFSFF
tara:strand:- start:1329 stop:1556 length:228 start_codon:yes stop_codon:yes gene_type:complete